MPRLKPVMWSTPQAQATNRKCRRNDREDEEVGSGVRPQQPAHPEFAKAHTVKPNHVNDRNAAGCRKGAVKRAGIAGLRSYDIHQQRREPSRAQAFRDQVEHAAREID